MPFDPFADDEEAKRLIDPAALEIGPPPSMPAPADPPPSLLTKALTALPHLKAPGVRGPDGVVRDAPSYLQMPATLDPQLIRDTLDKASQAGLLQGAMSRAPQNWFSMAHGLNMNVGNPQMEQAVQSRIMAPLTAARTAAQANAGQLAVQNKAAEDAFAASRDEAKERAGLAGKAIGGDVAQLVVAGRGNEARRTADVNNLARSDRQDTAAGDAQDLARLRSEEKMRQDAAKAGLAPTAAQRMADATKRSVAGVDGGGGALSPAALDQAAEMFARTGAMPAVARGRAGVAIAARIASRAAELHPDGDLAGNKAGYAADTGSLRKMQQQADAISAFENTALRNLDQFLGTARQVVDHGSPLFNAPARLFAEKVAGDPRMTAFNTARQVAVQEIGKILSGSTGAAAVSDSARHEVAGLLHPDASLAQIEAAANILKQDMHNRRTSVEAELAKVRGRAGSREPAAPQPVDDAKFKAFMQSIMGGQQ